VSTEARRLHLFGLDAAMPHCVGYSCLGKGMWFILSDDVVCTVPWGQKTDQALSPLPPSARPCCTSLCITNMQARTDIAKHPPTRTAALRAPTCQDLSHMQACRPYFDAGR
jgi:hypothetical protein